ncbi:hypothetical protein EV363DRAFT_1299662 [Boletus edulis]|nr:hypothetical protein EV363DRAFT_1299662 [Boletus edulis]
MPLGQETTNNVSRAEGPHRQSCALPSSPFNATKPQESPGLRSYHALPVTSFAAHSDELPAPEVFPSSKQTRRDNVKIQCFSQSPNRGRNRRKELRGLLIPSDPPPHPTVLESNVSQNACRSRFNEQSISTLPPNELVIEVRTQLPAEENGCLDVDELTTQTFRVLDAHFPKHIESLRNREVRAEIRLALHTRINEKDAALNTSDTDYAERSRRDEPTSRALSLLCLRDLSAQCGKRMRRQG